MKRFLVFSTFLLLLCSCNKSISKVNPGDDPNHGGDPVIITLSANQSKISSGGNINSINLFSLIVDDQLKSGKNSNIIISPLSLYIALAMTWNGAEGETKTEIQRFLGLEGLTEIEVNEYFKKLLDALPVTDPKAKLSIANSIWHDNGLAVLSEFKKNNSTYFNSEVNPLDFKNSGSVDIINKWCSDKTNGIIKKIIEQIQSDEVMFLINALYFKAPWSAPFDKDKTTTSPFVLASGSTVNTPMMSKTESMVYSENSDFKTLKLGYGNGSFSMVLILPSGNKSIKDITGIIREPSVWSSIIDNKLTSKVDIKIPRFKFEYENRLDPFIKTLGINRAFNASESELNKIANVGTEKLYISRIRQKAAIETNEEGSEAAAVTAIGVGVTSAPVLKEFYANRPFIFAITENSTNTVLFIGKVENPQLSN
jgi:serpin B